MSRPGPARPGPARNTIVIFEAQARPEPAGSGPGHWPDHIVIPQKTAILLLCTHSIVTGLLSCYVHNHMHFQCLCEI